MNNLKDLIKNQNIIYVTVNPERALGLEKILPQFYIVSLSDSYIFEFLDKNRFYSLQRQIPNINIRENSKELLLQKSVSEYIKNIDNPSFMFFKITKGVEEILKNKKILNTKSILNKKFENKLNLLENFKGMIPKSITFIPKDTTYDNLKEKFGNQFVIQFIMGHSGENTYFIKNKDEFDEIKNKYPKRFSKAVEFIEGNTYTINGVVTRKGIIVFNLSRQITGIETLTKHKGGTVGNDWLTKLPIHTKLDLLEKMTIIGKTLQKSGYKGLFGADFISDNNKTYLIEINPRENASVPTFTKIQIKNNQIPSKLIHILEFLNIEYSIDIEKINKEIFDDIDLRQIIIRNTTDNTINIKKDLNGVYNTDLEKIKDDYNISNIDKRQFLIISAKGEVNKNMEIARIQTKENIDDLTIDKIKKML